MSEQARSVRGGGRSSGAGGDGRQPPQQRDQPRRAIEKHLGPAARHQRRVPRELDRIAQPLLAVQQDGPSGEVLPFPGAGGHLRSAPCREAAARRVVGPRRGVVSRQEVGAGALETGPGVVGLARQRLGAGRQRRLETQQHPPQGLGGAGVPRLTREGRAVAFQGPLQVASVHQRVAQVVIEIGERRADARTPDGGLRESDRRRAGRTRRWRPILPTTPAAARRARW